MPCASITEAVDDMMLLVETAYGSLVSSGFQALLWDDVDGDRAAATDSGGVVPWAIAFLRHAGGRQSALAADGSARSRWLRTGVLTVELHTPLGGGRIEMDAALQTMLDGLEGVATEHGVWFRNVRIAENGREGGWYKASVLADFEYDEVK